MSETTEPVTEATPLPEAKVEEKTPSSIVVGQESTPCGCIIIKYADNRQTLTPCLACGLNGVANGLAHAVDALRSLADRLGKEAVRRNTQIATAAALAARRKPGGTFVLGT